jgi:hypothetical protein
VNDGTRFRIFPKYASGYVEPEVVTLSSPLGSIGPGPSSRRMYAVNPIDKPDHYDPPFYVPPYAGPCLPPALPGPEGHFDHIDPGAPEFRPAHLFGAAQHVIDVWEGYFGREFVWWHADVHPRLELVALVDWANAHSGPGFIETGRQIDRSGEMQLYCLNLDIIAHELGHAFLFSNMGVPRPEKISGAFLAFHEAFSDLVALVTALQFKSVMRRLLHQTDGNLYVLNLVSRIGPLSDLTQIRIADNTVKMADVADLELLASGDWYDPTGAGRNAHDFAQPLTGAIFDALVEIYQDGLVARGAIAPEIDARQWTHEEVAESLAWVHTASARAYSAFSEAFLESLVEARDIVGNALVHVMRVLPPDDLTFERVAAKFIEGCVEQGWRTNTEALIENFLWRGIDPHRAVRVGAADNRAAWRRLPYAERLKRVAAVGHKGHLCHDPHTIMLARSLMPHAHRSKPS